jgi:deoxyribonuclease-4
MPLLGAHLSIAGGLPRAIDRAIATDCQALQVFTKSVGQWRARPLGRDEIREFRRRRLRSPVRAAVAHASYLINLASADRAIGTRSFAALLDEYDRVEALGLDGLVLHPGAHTTSSPSDGLRRIGRSLARLLRTRPRARARLLLEHTAGQGSSLGHRFDQLAAMIEMAGASPRIGVCLDTCHLLAAGYDIRTAAGCARTLAELDACVGLDRVRVFHLNDSKRECGSRVDRHEHIGRGHVGLAAFAYLVNDPRFARLPMILETPKGRPLRSGADGLDRRNLRTLRALLRQ